MAGSTFTLGGSNPVIRGKNKFLKKENNKRENRIRKIKETKKNIHQWGVFSQFPKQVNFCSLLDF